MLVTLQVETFTLSQRYTLNSLKVHDTHKLKEVNDLPFPNVNQKHKNAKSESQPNGISYAAKKSYYRCCPNRGLWSPWDGYRTHGAERMQLERRFSQKISKTKRPSNRIFQRPVMVKILRIHCSQRPRMH